MLFYDFEVYKYNWMLSWLDTETRKMYTIHDDVDKMVGFYNYYKDTIWVGYNSRQYDVWIAKAILGGFDPFEMNEWIIKRKMKGWQFSKSLNQFQILNYDAQVGFRSLKELEAFMGHDIQETNVPFDIDRPLTLKELELVKTYNQHDVWETFNVFIETKEEYESHIGLIQEFGLPIEMINKTKAQISAEILGASQVKRRDEFDIILPNNLELGKYEYIKDHFINWGENVQDYEEVKLETEVADVPHVFAIGGIHGALNKYLGDGTYILADVSSYYPSSMVNYNYLSRNVSNPKKFEVILEERFAMKAQKDPREYPRKIVLNSTFGASKDQYNKLYDPRQANNLCIANQLFMVDLIEKLEGHCQIIQSNTDGVLMKLFHKDDEPKIMQICSDWEKRTGFSLGYDKYVKVIQRDVNNYIMVAEDGYMERKGAVVKKLHPLDNDLPIVNRAVVDYYTKGISPYDTIMASNDLIDFQKITKISGKYEYGFHENKLGETHTFKRASTNSRGEVIYIVEHYKGYKLHEKVHRCFASLDDNDGTVFKKHKDKTSLDKTASTPEKSFIDNGEITGKTVPKKLDRMWYIKEAERKIEEFLK